MPSMLPKIFMTEKGDKLAYHYTPGKTPGVIFLGGFMSDMSGTKAQFFENLCREKGIAYLRFDYQGHGASSGKFEQGSIGLWTENALDIFDNISQGPQILIGSSMGGWIMVLVALQRKMRIAGLMGIATAPDFMTSLIWEKLTVAQQQALEREGIFTVPAEGYDKPYAITQEMIDDGKRNAILNQPIDLHCPIRLVHGENDLDVPWQYSQKLMEMCRSKDVTLTLVKAGDHRLSKEHELKFLGDTLGTFYLGSH